MLEALYVLKDNIYYTWFAMLVFFMGFCCSWIVYDLNIKAFLWFPKWFIKVMSKVINPRSSFLNIVLVIFIFNSISIMLYMSSGLFIILPVIIAFLTGMNIGLTVFIPPDLSIEGYHIKEVRDPIKAFRMVLFSTLVLISEVLVFSMALGMGMSLGSAAATITSESMYSALFLSELLSIRMQAYVALCVPILAISAIMEASIIKGI